MLLTRALPPAQLHRCKGTTSVHNFLRLLIHRHRERLKRRRVDRHRNPLHSRVSRSVAIPPSLSRPPPGAPPPPPCVALYIFPASLCEAVVSRSRAESIAALSPPSIAFLASAKAFSPSPRPEPEVLRPSSFTF